MENSFIYGLWLTIWNAWLRLFNKSFLKRAAGKADAFLKKVFNGSFVRHVLFDDLGAENAFLKSKAGRLLNGLASAINRFGEKNGVRVKNSVLLSMVSSFIGGLWFVSMAHWGVLFAGFGASALAAGMVLDAGKTILVIGCSSIVFGALLVFLKRRSLAELCNGSFLISSVFEFFGAGIKSNRSEKNYLAVFASAGVLAGLGLVLFGVLGAAAVFGVMGFLLVMRNTEVGIIMTAALIPLLPTKLILGLAALCVFSYFVNLFFSGKYKIRFNLLDVFVLLYAVMLVINPLISFIPSSSVIVALTYFLYVLFYFAARNVLRTKKQLMLMVKLMVTAGFVVALFGVYQYLTGDMVQTDHWVDVEMFEETARRVYSTLDNPNVLGEYLLFLIPLAFSLIYCVKNPLHKIIFFGIACAGLLCMVFTSSRGAWLGLIFAVALFALVADRRLFWIALAAIALLPAVIPESIVTRFTSIGNLNDTSTSYRVFIWMASLVMIRQFWMTGIGMGTETFRYVYQKYAFDAVYAPHSHNLYLQITIDLGVLGLIFILGTVVMFFKKLLLRGGGKQMTALSVALCAGMLGYLVQGLTDNIWYNYRMVIFFWLIIAVSQVVHSITANKGEENNAEEKA